MRRAYPSYSQVLAIITGPADLNFQHGESRPATRQVYTEIPALGIESSLGRSLIPCSGAVEQEIDRLL